MPNDLPEEDQLTKANKRIEVLEGALEKIRTGMVPRYCGAYAELAKQALAADGGE